MSSPFYFSQLKHYQSSMKILYICLFVVAFVIFNSQTIRAENTNKLIDTNWLANHLEKDNLVILDIRNKIDGGSYETYLKSHIPGSLYSDYLTEWRATRDNVVGAIPQQSVLEHHLSNLGVHNDDHIVIVPAGVSATDFGSATRVYFILKYLGHKHISILNGGFAAWTSNSNNPIEVGTTSHSAIIPTQYSATPNEKLLITTKQLIASRQLSHKPVLIDARPQSFYTGKKKHPKVKRHGRIQGSLLLSHANFYNPKTNTLYNRDQAKTIYKNNLKNIGANVSDNDTIVTYCNTGHWASIDWFVLSELIGVKNIRHYDDSLAAWGNNNDLPIEKE